jgi:hypothetical protein
MAHRLDVRPAPPSRSAPLGVLAGALLLAACTSLAHQPYSAEAIEAWVVDGETGKPLEGVIVVANWLLMRGTIGGRSHLRPLVVLEAVSDANGRFFFPAWGPVPHDTAGFLDYEDPKLWFFKPGYGFSAVANHYGNDYRTKPSRRTSEWNGKSIRLKRFPGDEAAYAEHLARAGSSVESDLSWNRDCNIRKTPLLAKAVDLESTRLEKLGLDKGGFTFRRLTPEFLARCGVTASGEVVK